MKTRLASLSFVALMLVGGCGGGGGGDDTSVSATPPPAPPVGDAPAATPAPAPVPPVGLLPPDAPPNPESGPEAIGVFTGFTGNPSWLGGDGTGDGGGAVGDGADGGGGVGVGASLGRFSQAQVSVTLDDGRVIGPALTDGNGLVTVKPGKSYRGSLRISVVGLPGTNYFDEAKNADIAYPPSDQIRVHVDAIRGNIGVTALTEAAVRLAESLDVAPAEKIRQANEKVRTAINAQLPQGYLLDDITRLPTLIGPSSSQGALPATPAGIYGTVASALAIAAGRYNAALPAPGLSFANQIAKDLADGRLDGAGPTGEALAPPGELAYTPGELAGQLVASIETTNSRYAPPGTPTVTGPVTEGAFLFSGERRARLLSDGRVVLFTANGPGATLGSSVPATALFSDGRAMLIRRTAASGSLGDIEAIGDNSLSSSGDYYRFGLATPQSTGDVIALPALAGVTDVSFGTSHALARRSDGAVLGWGSNLYGQLAIQGTASVPSFSTGPVAINLGGSTARAVATGDSISFALLDDGRVLSWGTDIVGGLGRGVDTGDSELLPGLVKMNSAAEPLTGVTSIVAVQSNALVIRTDGSVWGWGFGLSGLLNEPGTFPDDRFAALPVAGLQNIRKLARTQGGMVALDDAGVVRYWGQGIGSDGNRLLAVVPGINVRIRDIQERGGFDGVLAVGVGGEEFIVVQPGAVRSGGGEPAAAAARTPS